MSTCNICGNEIEFRYINGKCIPIHNHGGCIDSTSAISTIKIKFENDFCKPTNCPICKADVFFIKHNGGTVWVDSLGHPWPKHLCLKSKGYKEITKLNNHFINIENMKLGLVVYTKTILNFKVIDTYMAIKTDNNSGICFELLGDRNVSIGSIAYISTGRNYSLFTIENGSVIKCNVKRKVEPKEIGLSDDWYKITGKILSEKKLDEKKSTNINSYCRKFDKFTSTLIPDIIQDIRVVYKKIKELNSDMIKQGALFKNTCYMNNDLLIENYNNQILNVIKYNKAITKKLKKLQPFE